MIEIGQRPVRGINPRGLAKNFRTVGARLPVSIVQKASATCRVVSCPDSINDPLMPMLTVV